ncbi:MAG: type II toxin-antitoxin system BrnA family antitoxin [Candidatus Sumerlaeaceae bacterium]
MGKLKTIPKFKNEDEERAFLGSHDSCDYIDWSKARRVTFPKLRPSLKTISLRLPVTMLEELKIAANQQDVAYQSLIKIILAEHLEKKRVSRQVQIGARRRVAKSPRP